MFPDPDHFELVKRKGVFCYDYVSTWYRLKEAQLPIKDNVQRKLKEKLISSCMLKRYGLNITVEAYPIILIYT